jgi:hypothetical protein
MNKTKKRLLIFGGVGVLAFLLILSVFLGVFQQTTLGEDATDGVSVYLPDGVYGLSADSLNTRVQEGGFVQQTALGSVKVGSQTVIMEIEDNRSWWQKLFGASLVQQSVMYSQLSDADKQLVSAGKLTMTESLARSRGYTWIPDDPASNEQRMRENPKIVAIIGDKASDNTIPITYRDKSTGQIKSVTTIAYRTQLDFRTQDVGGNSWTLKETGVLNRDSGVSTVMYDRNVYSSTYTKTGASVYDSNGKIITENFCQAFPKRCAGGEVTNLSGSNLTLSDFEGALPEPIRNDQSGGVEGEQNFAQKWGIPIVAVCVIVLVIIVVIVIRKKPGKRRRK